MIICHYAEMQVILEQLKDLKLYAESKEDEVVEKNLVKKYYFREDEIQKVAISIRIPSDMINKKAEELGLKCSITKLDLNTIINVPYKNDKKNFYNCFAQAERCEAIEEILKDQIDFDYFTEAEIIESHFHLHRRTCIEDIQESFDKYQSKLESGLLGLND